MIILIPMGGKGTRFSEAGYSLNKACIPTTDRHSGKKYPMAVCAMKDVPEIDNPTNKIICVNRDFHATNGTEDAIRSFFPSTIFIHDQVLLDQAYGCYLAKEHLNSDDELFIGACDNGIDLDIDAFNTLKKDADAIMISHSNDENIRQNPEAHSWARISPDTTRITELSLKKTVSKTPMQDHATTGMFWFKRADVFLHYLEQMIEKKDMYNGKYYVDKLLQYYINDERDVHYFDVNYLCWGTPKDYEEYEKNLAYWKSFLDKEGNNG